MLSLVLVIVLVLGMTAFSPLSTAQAATNRFTQTGVIAVGEQRQATVYLEVGMQYEIIANCGTPNTLDPIILLYDPNGVFVDGDDDSGPYSCGGYWSSYFTYTATMTGNYTLVWRGFALLSGGPYTVMVNWLNDGFSGPGLPAVRNLVLFNEDAPVYSAPGGTPLGRTIRACQTAFITATSEDGLWGRAFVMGGWVSLANTTDVPETYGQPGSPVAPNCVGR